MGIVAINKNKHFFENFDIVLNFWAFKILVASIGYYKNFSWINNLIYLKYNAYYN